MTTGIRPIGGVLFILGTRPEAIKLAPVVIALATRGVPFAICCTGQHATLARAALADFALAPDIDLDLMTIGQDPGTFVATALPRLAAVVAAVAPALVVVQGDTASALAGALAASYARVPLAHVEAGLRSHDPEPFPEDLHRRLIGQIAARHFAPTQRAVAALAAEGIAAATIDLTGNTVIDAVHHIARRLAAEPALAAGAAARLPPLRGRPLVLITAHRRENRGRMTAIATAIVELARVRDVDIVVPLHPHPAAGAVLRKALIDIDHVALVPPLDYLAFIAMLCRAHLVISDSGGIQEEAPALGVPVLILRDVTERPEGVAAGSARLVGTDPARIVAEACALLDDDIAHSAMAGARHPYGDGHAAEQIATRIMAMLGTRCLVPVE